MLRRASISYIEGGTYANPEMCALNSAAGTQRWCIPGNEISVANGLAAVTGQTSFSVLDASSGKQLWSSPNHFVTLNNGVVYTVDTTNAVDALNASSGALLWSS